MYDVRTDYRQEIKHEYFGVVNMDTDYIFDCEVGLVMQNNNGDGDQRE